MLQIGSTLKGAYVLERLLESGRAADVYAARLSSLPEKQVTVTVASRKVGAPGDASRFTGLLRARAALSHRALAEVLDFWEDGACYVVTSFIPGKTLRRLKEEQGQGLTPSRVQGWLSALCDVLAFLHGQAVPMAFGDLRLENVVVDERDEIHLVLYDPASLVDGQAKPVQEDLQALGAVLYELLTGQPPPDPSDLFFGGGALVSPRSLNPQVSPALESVVQRLLAPSPREAFASVGEVRDALASGTRRPSPFAVGVVTEDLSTVTPVEEKVARSGGQIASVLYLDIVGYSKLRNEEQVRARADVERTLREAPQLSTLSPRNYYLDARAGDAVVLVFYDALMGPVETAGYLQQALVARGGPAVRIGLHVGTVVFGPGGVPLGEALTIGQYVADAGQPMGITASMVYADMLASVSDRYDELLGTPREIVTGSGKRLRVVSVGETPGETAEATPARADEMAAVAANVRAMQHEFEGERSGGATPVPVAAGRTLQGDFTDPGLAAVPTGRTLQEDFTDPGLAAVPTGRTLQEDFTDPGRAAVSTGRTLQEDFTDPGLAAAPTGRTLPEDFTDPGLAAAPTGRTLHEDFTDPGLAAMPSLHSSREDRPALRPAPTPPQAAPAVTLESRLPTTEPAPRPAAPPPPASPPVVVGVQLRVLEGRDQGRIVPLGESEVRLGRGIPSQGKPDQVYFEEPTVSREQAVLRWDARSRGYTIFHGGKATNPTVINDHPVSRQALQLGDRIQMGLLVLRMEIAVPEVSAPVSLDVAPSAPRDVAPPPPPPQSPFRLEVQCRGSVSRSCLVGDAPVTIGRAACDLTIEDAGVSRRHAMVYPRGGDCWIRHESATNPTVINGRPVTQDTRLSHGDLIHLSRDTILRFVDTRREAV